MRSEIVVIGFDVQAWLQDGTQVYAVTIRAPFQVEKAKMLAVTAIADTKRALLQWARGEWDNSIFEGGIILPNHTDRIQHQPSIHLLDFAVEE